MHKHFNHQICTILALYHIMLVPYGFSYIERWDESSQEICANSWEIKRRPRNMHPSSLRWLSLVGAIWLQAVNDPNGDFSLYSTQLKELKHISQFGLNFLAFASDAGKLFGWFSGVAVTYLPPWSVSTIGAALAMIGYGVQFLLIEDSHFTYFSMFLLSALAGCGLCWMTTACNRICMRNFPHDSRMAASLSASYFGLSAKVYTVMASAVYGRKQFNHEPKLYLLLNAVAPVVVAVTTAPFLRLIQEKNTKEAGLLFVVALVITIATGVFAVFGSFEPASKWLSPEGNAATMGVLLAMPLMLPLALVIGEEMGDMCGDTKVIRIHDLMIEQVEGGVEEPQEKEGVSPSPQQGQMEDVRGLHLFRKVDFWLYFCGYMFSATLGLVFSYNLGQIAESRGIEKISTLVSLYSSFRFFGRLAPFFLDYYTSITNCSIPRPATMAVLMAPMAGAFFLLVDPRKKALYASTTIIGVCSGAIATAAIGTTSELFGARNFSVNHNIVQVNIPVGSLAFGLLAAHLYERGVQSGSRRCVGASCYERTFVIWGCACSLGTLLCVLLYMRTRNSCSRGIPRTSHQ